MSSRFIELEEDDFEDFYWMIMISRREPLLEELLEELLLDLDLLVYV